MPALVTGLSCRSLTQIIRNARLVDELTEDGVTFVSATGGGTYDPATNRVTWELGDIAPDQPAVTRDVTEDDEENLAYHRRSAA